MNTNLIKNMCDKDEESRRLPERFCMWVRLNCRINKKDF